MILIRICMCVGMYVYAIIFMVYYMQVIFNLKCMLYNIILQNYLYL